MGHIADIEARRGHLAASVDALEHAVAIAPGSPSLYERLSQADASAGAGRAALHAIQGALALQPHDPTIFAHKHLATWVGNIARHRTAIVSSAPSIRATSRLHLPSRVSARGPGTPIRRPEYRSYLWADGANPAVWLELAKTESWRGNYAAALEALEAYRNHFGETGRVQDGKGCRTANGGQPSKAEDFLKSLLVQSPGSYELNLTHAIALARQLARRRRSKHWKPFEHCRRKAGNAQR